MSLKRIVVIGGGTGTFMVLQALRDTPCDLTAIVSTADDGGSTGILRDELGVLPPGDLRQALVALADDSSMMRELLNYRFQEGGLKGHNFGNLFISALEKVTGRFDTAIMEAGKILSIRGQVLPVTSDQMHLRAETVDGDVIKGEHAIEEHIWKSKATLHKFWLEPSCKLHPSARQAILRADLVVIAPGSLYTSLVPNFLTTGMQEVIQKSRAKLVFISNLMTEWGQAEDFYLQDFVDVIETYLGHGQIDYVLYNKRKPSAQLLARYQRERERLPVTVDRKRKKTHYRMIGANLLSTNGGKTVKGDPLANERTLIRHDAKRLGRALTALLYLKEAEQYLR